MRIAMLGHKRIPSREGGVEIVVEELATRLVNKGYEVDVYNRKGNNVSDNNIKTKKIKENSLDPGKALIIGDTLHDAEVAKALGINCILYSGGHNNYNLLTKKSKVIRNLKDILPH